MSAAQVTASKTALVLECARAMSDVDREVTVPTEPMRYGSALHELLEIEGVRKDAKVIAAKWDVDALELYPHAVRTVAALKKWMSGENCFRETFTVVGRETHRATKLTAVNGIPAVQTRECDFDVETHTYDLREGEFGGTDDILLRGASGRVVVCDYKSGDWGDFHIPATLPQMLTLAIQTEASAVAILHSPREGVPVMYCDEVDEDTIAAFGHRLLTAMARTGDGSLRPGPWCKRCPALEGCPAQDAALLKKASALIKAAVGSDALLGAPVDKGAFHLFLGELSRLEKRARDILRAEVRGGEIITRPDGKTLTIRVSQVESLSKASVVRAMGKQKGEKMIEKLRELGAVETREQESLVAVDG